MRAAKRETLREAWLGGTASRQCTMNDTGRQPTVCQQPRNARLRGCQRCRAHRELLKHINTCARRWQASAAQCAEGDQLRHLMRVLLALPI